MAELATVLAPPVYIPNKTKCLKCGGEAKLVVFTRSGAPLFSCTTSACKHRWVLEPVH